MGMRKTVVLLASMAAAVVLASMVAMAKTQNTARAAFPGTNAKIVFASAFPDRTVVEDYPPEHETTYLCASTQRRRA